MKTIVMKLIAIVLVLACAVTLFGCESEETTSSRRRSRRSSSAKGETVMTAPEETPFEEQTEETGRRTETVTPTKKSEQTTEKSTEQVADALPKPGSIQMPATRLMDYKYDQLLKMDWDAIVTEDKSGGLLVTEAYNTTFYFRFDDIKDKPTVLSVDDWDCNGKAYISYDIQIGDTADLLPNAVRECIGAMDGGLLASCKLESYSADFLLDGDMDHVDDAVLYCVQLRREN